MTSQKFSNQIYNSLLLFTYLAAVTVMYFAFHAQQQNEIKAADDYQKPPFSHDVMYDKVLAIEVTKKQMKSASATEEIKSLEEKLYKQKLDYNNIANQYSTDETLKWALPNNIE